MSKEPVSLSAVVASNMRRIRMERGLLQEDIATAARWVGLKWSSVTVTQIESQSRSLSLDDFLLLPLVLRCPIKELLLTDDKDQLIELGYGTVLSAGTVLGLVADNGPQLRDDQVPMLPGLEANLNPKVVDAVVTAGLEGTLLSYLLVREGARGEAERKAAKTMKVPATEITGYALRLWGRSLTVERDHRAAHQATGEKENRAIRGHITRSLLNELSQPWGEQRQTGWLKIIPLQPASDNERDLRKILIRDYQKDSAVREKAKKPYEQWMRLKILEAFEKKGTVG
jgi:transcriptional regulator with XRE-family HTH domain